MTAMMVHCLNLLSSVSKRKSSMFNYVGVSYLLTNHFVMDKPAKISILNKKRDWLNLNEIKIMICIDKVFNLLFYNSKRTIFDSDRNVQNKK